MWPYPWTHVGTPSHLGHMDRVAATMPSQAHAGAAQEATDIGQLEGQDVPFVRPSSCFVKGGIPSSRRYLPTYLIEAKGIPMSAPGQAWSTKAFLVDGSQCQPTRDEAFIRRVEAVPMRVMFEEKSDPTERVDVLSHSEMDRVVAYMRMGMHDRVAARKERAQAKSPHWWDDRELVTGKFE